MPNALRLTRRGVIAGTAALFAARPLRAGETLTLRAGGAELPFADAGLKAPAFNDLAAGPLIEMERGKPFTLTVRNELDLPFRLRTQGLRGKPVQGNDTPVAPGETRELIVTPPDSGTFVYCGAAEDAENAAHTALLSGPLIVDADAPRIADREALVAVNTILLPGGDDTKPPRRVVAVNGAAGLKLAARPSEQLRLRLVNLAQTGIAGLKVPKGARIVAIDGQPCPSFPPFDDAVILPPLGRADIVLEVPRDTPSLTITDAFDTALALVSITVEGEAVPDRFLANELPANPLLPSEIPFRSAARMTWKPADAAPAPLKVEAGGSAILTIENDGTPRALMLEGLTVRLLDALDDGWKPWWQDSVLVHSGETARVAFATPAPGRYAVDLLPLEGTGAPSRAWIDVE